MNPGYIYKPPPPPPIPKPPPPEGGNRHPQFPVHRGGRGGRGNGPGGGGGRGGGRGGGPGGGSPGGVGRGGAGRGRGGFGGHGVQQHHQSPPQHQQYVQPQQQHHQQQQQPPLPPYPPPGAHINPQFYPHLATAQPTQHHHQRQYPQQPPVLQQQSYYLHPPQGTPQPLFPAYPQQSQLFPSTTPQTDYSHLQQQPPTNPYQSYTQDFTNPAHRRPAPPAPPIWPAQPSYGHYHPPPPTPQYGGGGYHFHTQRGGGRGGGGFGPPNKRQKRGGDEYSGASKPDMDHETWMKLNGGKILGTNISLDTPEDVVEWIKARKARWPTAQRIKEKEDCKKREEEAKKRAAEESNVEKELEAVEVRRKEKREKNLKKKQRSKEKKAKEAAERKVKENEAKKKEGEQVVDGSRKRKREDEREDEKEGEVDVYKLQYASDSYPEDDDDKTVDQEGGKGGEKVKGGEVLMVQRGGGEAYGDKSVQNSSPQTAPESGGGVSTGLMELEKILNAGPPETAVPKLLVDENGNPITDDRFIDYDSQASDYEGGDGPGKEGEEMVNDDGSGGNEDGDSDETNSLSADMSLASDDDDHGSGNDSDSGESSSDSDSDAEEISSKGPLGNQPPLPNTTSTTQPNTKEKGKKKNPCKYFQTTGKCKNGDTCRYSHTSPANPKVKDLQGDKGGEGRVSLHERMMRQQRERENEVVVRAVRWLFESGGLEKPADAGEIEKEMREGEQRKGEGGRGGRNKRGGGGFGGRRGGRRGGQMNKSPGVRGRFKKRGGGVRGGGV